MRCGDSGHFPLKWRYADPRGSGPTGSYAMTRRLLLTAKLIALLFVGTALAGTAPPTPARYIVQAPTALAAHQYVERAGARVERDLPIINGVSAFLDPWEVTRLRATAGVRLYEDRALA